MANPIDEKKIPNIFPLFAGIAKSYMAAVIIGGNKDTAIPCRIRTVKREFKSNRKPRRMNDNDCTAKAKRIIRFFPSLLAAVPTGSLRKMAKIEGIAIKMPKSK